MLLTAQTGKSGIFEDDKLIFLLAENGPYGVKNRQNGQNEQIF
jgi:hypothetical protein